MTRESRAPPIVAIVLLLLPVLYVGSYFALVVPQGREIIIETPNSWFPAVRVEVHYRVMPEQAERIYWPLEQIDRKARPGAW